MSMSTNILSPKPTAPELFTDAIAAVARIEEIYERNTEFLRGHFEAYERSEPFVTRVRATYPFVRRGVSILEAADEFDAGPIWAAHEFALEENPPAKSSLYRGQVRKPWLLRLPSRHDPMRPPPGFAAKTIALAWRHHAPLSVSLANFSAMFQAPAGRCP